MSGPQHRDVARRQRALSWKLKTEYLHQIVLPSMHDSHQWVGLQADPVSDPHDFDQRIRFQQRYPKVNSIPKALPTPPTRIAHALLSNKQHRTLVKWPSLSTAGLHLHPSTNGSGLPPCNAPQVHHGPPLPVLGVSHPRLERI